MNIGRTNIYMRYWRELHAAINCEIVRRRLKHRIRQSGGRISANVKLSIAGKMEFGKALFLNGKGITTCNKMQIIVASEAFLKLGDYTGLSSSSIYCKKNITIGNHVNIGAECLIIDSDFHSSNWEDRENREIDKNKAKSAPIHISDYVFIGARSIILKGVSIGEKSIIMAGSVVNKDIPSNCIAGGNPCRILKFIE